MTDSIEKSTSPPLHYEEHQPTPLEHGSKGKYDDSNLVPIGYAEQDPNFKQRIPLSAWIVLALATLGQCQNTFLGIAPAANAYAIAGALNGNDKRIWIVQAQGIPSVITGPIMAIFADIYGRKWVVVGAWAISLVATIVAMTTNSIDVLIFAQTLSGCGAGISGLCYAIPSEVMPSRYRAVVQTVLIAVSGLMSFPALVGMGAATVNDPVNGWRWVFRTLTIMNGILVIGFALFYNPPARTESKQSAWTRFKTLDWIGYFLLFSGLVPLLAGFAWASDLGWKDPHSYGAVAAGAVGFIACLLYEWKGRSDGFIHHALFTQGRNFPIAIFAIAVEGSLFYLINNIWPSQVFTLYFSPSQSIANYYLLPFFLIIFVVAPPLSYYSTKSKDVKWPIVAGFVAFLAAMICFGVTTPTSKNLGLAADLLAGLGFSSPLVLLMTVVQLSTPPLFIGIASALTISARTLGGTVGYAIAEVIYSNRSGSRLANNIAAAVIPLGFSPAGLGELIPFVASGGRTAPVSGATTSILAAANAAAAQAYAYGFRVTWLAFLPGVVCAIVLCSFFQNPKERINWVVDAPLEQAHQPADNEANVVGSGEK